MSGRWEQGIEGLRWHAREDPIEACIEIEWCTNAFWLRLGQSIVLAVFAACREAGVQPGSFVSTYYRKDTIAAVWNQEVFGFAMVDTFVLENANKVYIPDPATMIAHRDHRKTHRIRNGMDEAEAGRSIKYCTNCGNLGHNYKRCLLTDLRGSAEAGPSGNTADGAPPDFRTSSARRSNILASSTRSSVSRR